MPTKRTTTEPVENEAVVTDPWRTMEEIFIPRENGSQSMFVAVNGRTFMIPCGRTVSVPAPVAEVIRNSQEAMIEADKAAEALRNN